MKRRTFKSLFCLVMILALLALSFPVLADTAAPFRYEHDPRLNPAAMSDIIVDPNAVYGFSPNPDSARLGTYAQYDWSDAQLIADSRQARIEYHASLSELYELKDSLAAQGKNIEEIARAVSYQRNVIRLRSYDDPQALASVKESNLAAYGDENGPTADSLYEKYGSWEMVLEKAFSTNSGMDACLGLYDDYYDLYVMIGQIPELYCADAVQWIYSKGIAEPITMGVLDTSSVCTRAEAVTLIYGAAGSPECSGSGIPFADADTNAYYFPALCWAYEQGITNGTALNTFSPDGTVTYAQLVTMLYRFTCAEYGETQEPWYSAAVSWAADTGVGPDTGSGTLSPDAVCDLGIAAQLLYRCAGNG